MSKPLLWQFNAQTGEQEATAMNTPGANARNAHRTRAAALMSALLLSATAGTLAETLPGPLVDSAWLEQHRDQVTLLDVRADVNSFSKRSRGGSAVNPCGAGVKGKEAEPVSGHIDGATLVRWSLLTAPREVDGVKVDGWLPSPDDFERLMQKSGVNQGAPVVIAYKGERAMEAAMAARLYYTLKYFGHDNLAILDGGTAAWLRSGRDVEFGRSSAKRGDFEAGPGRAALLASAEDVQAMSAEEEAQLVDVRGPAGYLGVAAKLPGVDPRWHGHIPGAKNLPMTLLSNDFGPVASLFDAETQRKTQVLMGMDSDAPTTLYCNSGVMASLGWYVFSELLGNPDVRLYDGSMQDWAARKLPVAAMQAP